MTNVIVVLQGSPRGRPHGLGSFVVILGLVPTVAWVAGREGHLVRVGVAPPYPRRWTCLHRGAGKGEDGIQFSLFWPQGQDRPMPRQSPSCPWLRICNVDRDTLSAGRWPLVPAGEAGLSGLCPLPRQPPPLLGVVSPSLHLLLCLCSPCLPTALVVSVLGW